VKKDAVLAARSFTEILLGAGQAAPCRRELPGVALLPRTVRSRVLVHLSLARIRPRPAEKPTQKSNVSVSA
jgi:hypothetical protein